MGLFCQVLRLCGKKVPEVAFMWGFSIKNPKKASREGWYPGKIDKKWKKAHFSNHPANPG